MDTNVPKMLKQAMIISSDIDNMQEMKIKSRETMNISKFVTAITRQLTPPHEEESMVSNPRIEQRSSVSNIIKELD